MAPKASGTEVPAGGDSPRLEETTTAQAASAGSASTTTPAPTTSTPPPGIPGNDEQPTAENFKKLLEQFKSVQDELNTLKLELGSKRFLTAQAQAAEHVRISTPIDLEADDVNLIKPPKPLDRKDVDKPDKYSGNTDLWLRWSKAFRKFLRRQDGRWGPLLDKVEAQRGRPVTAELEKEWAQQVHIGDYIADFKEQLNEYLETSRR